MPPFTVTAREGSFGALAPDGTATVKTTFQPQTTVVVTPQTLTIATDPRTAGELNVTVKGTGK